MTPVKSETEGLNPESPARWATKGLRVSCPGVPQSQVYFSGRQRREADQSPSGLCPEKEKAP